MIMTDSMYLASTAQNYLFLILPIVGSVMIVYAVFGLVRDLRRSEHQKLMQRLEGKSKFQGKGSLPSVLRRSLEDKPTNALDALFQKFRVVSKLQGVLDQANLPWSASRTLINLFGLGALAFLACLLGGKGPLWGLALAVAIVLLPIVYFVKRRARRLHKLVRQLPDVFELMGQALAAGHSLASSIQLISEQMPDPAGTEFGRVFHEQNLGIKIEEALVNMAERAGMLDLRFFVTAVLISRSTGGDLREVLEKISSIIRQRIELFGQVKTLTAEGRMSGWVLFVLPMVVFAGAMGLNPDYASVLIDDPRGKLLLVVAIFMQLMGMAMIRFIVNIKV
jgi:tight adherence protein B